MCMTCRYTDQDFDAEFIQVLQQACQKYIENVEDGATLKEVARFVQEKVRPMQPSFMRFYDTFQGMIS